MHVRSAPQPAQTRLPCAEMWLRARGRELLTPHPLRLGLSHLAEQRQNVQGHACVALGDNSLPRGAKERRFRLINKWITRKALSS